MSNNSSNGPTKSEDHNTRLITIIISLVTAIVGAPTLYNVISDMFFAPNVTMDFLVNDLTKSNITLEVKNIGNEAATHYSLTLESPYNILDSQLFLTENYNNTKVLLLDKKLLQISIPRLVQGQGSLIKLNLFVNPQESSNLNNDKFIAYSTFDQGSSKSEISIKDKKSISFYEQLTETIKSMISDFGILYDQLIETIKSILNVFGIHLSSASINGTILTIIILIIGITIIKRIFA
jgi:hypothetical protein